MTHTREVLIGEADGTFYAASTQSPFFCFTASSEEEAVAVARRAYAFYREHSGDQPASTSRTYTVTALTSARRINVDQMEAA